MTLSFRMEKNVFQVATDVEFSYSLFMRSLSWLIIILALIVSWNYFEKTDKLSWQNQVSIQLGLREFITSYIQTELPEAKNIKFISLWSEKFSPEHVRVHFEYAFDHPINGDITQLKLKGKANLSPIENDPDKGWSLGSIDIDSESLDFQNGSLIQRSDNPDPDADI